MSEVWTGPEEFIGDKVRVEREAIRNEIRSRYPDNRQGRRAAERAMKKAGVWK